MSSPIIFQFFFVISIPGNEDANKEFIYKCRFSEYSTGTSKLTLSDTNWSKVKQCRKANQACVNFLTLLIHNMINASQ